MLKYAFKLLDSDFENLCYTLRVLFEICCGIWKFALNCGNMLWGIWAQIRPKYALKSFDIYFFNLSITLQELHSKYARKYDKICWYMPKYENMHQKSLRHDFMAFMAFTKKFQKLCRNHLQASTNWGSSK